MSFGETFRPIKINMIQSNYNVVTFILQDQSLIQKAKKEKSDINVSLGIGIIRRLFFFYGRFKMDFLSAVNS